MFKLISLLFCIFCFVSLSVGFSQSQKPTINPEKYLPSYNASGALIRPQETEEWVFVGSNLGLSYKKGGRTGTPDFINVYISPYAYSEYRQSGKFPQGTMLLLDRYSREGKSPENPILTDGYYNGKRIGFEIAVKDNQRPNKRDNSKAEWAYYAFGSGENLKNTARAFPDKACQTCHEKHASEDHVWVQFYPVLKRAKARFKTEK